MAELWMRTSRKVKHYPVEHIGCGCANSMGLTTVRIIPYTYANLGDERPIARPSIVMSISEAETLIADLRQYVAKAKKYEKDKR